MRYPVFHRINRYGYPLYRKSKTICSGLKCKNIIKHVEGLCDEHFSGVTNYLIDWFKYYFYRPKEIYSSHYKDAFDCLLLELIELRFSYGKAHKVLRECRDIAKHEVEFEEKFYKL